MKNKFCPYRRHCRDECYGENPCSFAKAFDGIHSKLEAQKKENTKLKRKLARYEELGTVKELEEALYDAYG